MTSDESPLPEDIGSAWHRPRLYITIVVLYLYSSTIVEVIIAGAITVFITRLMAEGGEGFAGLTLVILYPWLAIVFALSLGAAITLTQGHKRGIYISLPALILMTLTLPSSIFLLNVIYDPVVLYYPPPYTPMRGQPLDSLFPYFEYAALIVSLSMFLALVLGWRQNKWR